MIVNVRTQAVEVESDLLLHLKALQRVRVGEELVNDRGNGKPLR